MMRGLRVVLVEDANATRSDAEHQATLVSIHQVFGDVRPTDDVIRLLDAGNG
jgi:ureidoacrylate peracid hydrolase